MGSRSFNTVVVLFWVATMSWLTVEKIVPTLRVGEPPNYQSIVAQRDADIPVCWTIYWNDRPLGWATNTMHRLDGGMTEIHGQVFFAEMPLDEVAPAWLGAFVRPILKKVSRLEMEAKSRLEIDGLGRLVGFESRVRIGDMPEAIHMQGEIDGAVLKLTVQSGEFLYKTERFLPANALVGDALSPQVQLPGLRIGQQWTVPAYSPFRPPNSPMEILEANVERREPLMWNGKSVSALVVVYQADSGSGLLTAREPRGKLWVAEDGTVLKQQVTLFNSNLHFIRLAQEDAEQLVKSVAAGPSGGVSLLQAREMFSELELDEP